MSEKTVTAEQVREWLKAQRKFFHETYNGGHHEKETNEAFHHGMDTVFNGMDELIPPMMKTWENNLKRFVRGLDMLRRDPGIVLNVNVLFLTDAQSAVTRVIGEGLRKMVGFLLEGKEWDGREAYTPPELPDGPEQSEVEQ